MRCLDINKLRIFYATYEGREELKDSNGYYTGEWKTKYSEPKEYFITVSESRNGAQNETQGITTQYTRTMVTDDMDCEIQTDSILWIDISPELPHNYKVLQVSKGLDSIAFVIKEVTSGET